MTKDFISIEEHPKEGQMLKSKCSDEVPIWEVFRHRTSCPAEPATDLPRRQGGVLCLQLERLAFLIIEQSNADI